MESLSVAEKWDRVAMSVKIDPTKRGWMGELSKTLQYKHQNTVSVYLANDRFPERSLRNRLLRTFSINLNEALNVKSIVDRMPNVTACKESVRRSDYEARPNFQQLYLKEEEYLDLVKKIEDHFREVVYVSPGKNLLTDCMDYIKANDFLRNRFTKNHVLPIGLQDLLWAYRFPIESWLERHSILVMTPKSSISTVTEPLKDNEEVSSSDMSHELFIEMCKQLKSLGKSLGLDVSISF